MKPLFLWLSLVAIIVLFCLFIGYFAVNLPQGDDFDLILHFLTNYLTNAHTLYDKWSLLTAQFVEHRLFYTRFVVLGQYLLTGSVSFYLIILIGNLSLAGILYIVYRQLRGANLPVHFLLPAALIIFQPSYSFDGVLWPAATLAYNSVAFFAILTIHWLSTSKPVNLGLAILGALLCTYTFGNGMLIWGVGLMLLCLQKRWKDTAFWVGAIALIMGFYFSNYVHYQSRNNPLSHLLEHPLYVIINFFVFTGSALNWSEQWPKNLASDDYWSIIAGILITCLYLFLLYKVLVSFLHKSPDTDKTLSRYRIFIVGVLTFIILTGLLLTTARVHRDDILMHINRYRVHSVVVLVVSYMYLIPWLQSKQRGFLVVTSLTLFFAVLSYFSFYNIFDFYKRNFTAGQFNWQQNSEWFIYRDTAYWEGASKLVLNEAKKVKTYEVPPSAFKVLPVSDSTQGLEIKLEPQAKELHLKGFADDLSSIGHQNDYYFVFKNLSTNKIYLEASHYDHRSFRLVLMGNPYYYGNFNTFITYAHFPKGKYQIGYARVNAQNELSYYWQASYFDQ